ncbi:MAG: V-type ATPase 116kDa subunit family protein [Bacteroidales bacterium]
MKKYAFLIYHREYDQFLEDIRNLGVVHVIAKESGYLENEELREKYNQIQQLNHALKFLEKRGVEKESYSSPADGLKILAELRRLQVEEEQLLHQISVLQKDMTLIEPWGDFSWETIKKIEEAGLTVRFFTCQTTKFKEQIENKYPVKLINDSGSIAYFVLIEKRGEESEIEAEEIRIPEVSLSKLKLQIDELNQTHIKINSLLDKLASQHISALEKARDLIHKQLTFEKVVLNTRKEAENRLMILEGWVPSDKSDALDNFLKTSGAYFESITPTPEETPPVKLKNNKFAKLYESIGELYTFPDYKEIDLTPFFAPFYMLFFGFCLGDAGYGLLIILGTLYGIFKVKPTLKPLLKLGLYLGIATTFMGIVSGTFFGIIIAKVNWPWITSYKALVLDDQKMMMLALVLGYVQVLFGMYIKAANRARMFGFKYAISQLGWNLIVMVTLPAFMLGYFKIIDVGLANNIALISLITGGIPAIFYNSPGKNPLLNLGVGLWETYQTVSGLLGDILSYIRLFALGISSAILGNVFNTLAMDLSPDIIVVKQIVMILILAFGHSLNFFMAALGSFVHPLRLTFVEFYKNAGFIGGGKKYEPFK